MASNPSSIFPSFHRKPRQTDAAVKESREAAIREAKQRVREVVRNDWSFDPPSSLFSSSPPPVAATTSSSAPSAPELQSEVLEWRQREYATSESDPEEEEAGSAAAGKGGDHDPYRFENPDAVRASVVERRRRWRRALEEEMRWNPGLRFWMERRDAWTGAKKRRVIRESLKELQEQQRQQSGDAAAQSKDIPSGTPSAQGHDSSLASSDATDKGPEREETSRGSTPSAPSPNEKMGALSLSKDSSGYEEGDNRLTTEETDYDSEESLIPVVEPLLPKSNPIRSSITPALYASIYSKVVVQGLTPTIPINLADMTKALVEGWKADGQWPPKPTVPLPGSEIPTRRKQADNNNHTIESAAPGNKARKDSHSHGSGVTHAVKKVLGLGHHSFHLRRSSRGGSQAESEASGARASGEMSLTEVPVVEEDGGQPLR
ncbi:hypothetical protein VTN96DRAFT_8511 [Rasamsonia emersonii]|uniref:Gag1-like clamp domain-containing protein n=1 Tax=Rasamsonia emersonii (strain ATCC 16479 / CBS 393.64 / IMI 116815) TaxID=1408163 RepID=A0A0F4YRT1_RASE3|nr:hypothetical protein T310_5205 [Rasamsonia emersonii CBS 393.64]KKA20790.1 hypothetical protein T310_5205 [Rasamsonia emersonii CBS 393.64]